MKTMATAVVSLPSTVGVPIEPNTAWLPPPPNAEPISAPLPACSRTSPMMIRLTRICRITRSTKSMGVLLLWRAARGGGFLYDGDEARRLQARASHQNPVDIGFLSELGGIVSLHAAPVEDSNGLSEILRPDLGHEATEITVDLRSLGRRRVHPGSDGPDGLICKRAPPHVL